MTRETEVAHLKEVLKQLEVQNFDGVVTELPDSSDGLNFLIDFSVDEEKLKELLSFLEEHSDLDVSSMISRLDIEV